jgi:hypothetical protein
MQSHKLTGPQGILKSVRITARAVQYDDLNHRVFSPVGNECLPVYNIRFKIIQSVQKSPCA